MLSIAQFRHFFCILIILYFKISRKFCCRCFDENYWVRPISPLTTLQESSRNIEICWKTKLNVYILENKILGLVQNSEFISCHHHHSLWNSKWCWTFFSLFDLLWQEHLDFVIYLLKNFISKCFIIICFFEEDIICTCKLYIIILFMQDFLKSIP